MTTMLNLQPNSNAAHRVKVMIIDDSAIIRGLVSRWISAESDFEMVGVGVNGRDGVNRVTSLNPDVIILDIEMPEMDGITALPLLLKAVPGVKIIMASTLTKAGAEVTIKALTLGAADYIPKPDAGKIAGAEEYKRDLFSKLRAFGQRRPRRAPFAPIPSNSNVIAPISRPLGGIINNNNNVRLRNDTTKLRPEALFIGSSTGGPEALRTLVGGLAGKVNVPVFLTQHMPVLFTKILAEHLSKQTGAKVIEAEHNMVAVPGVFYIAPGGKHMVVSRSAGVVRTLLNEDPPENFCRPAVDPLFRSAALVYGDRAMGVILTGMGHDGRDGAKHMVEKKSHILVQDEATSVVWGMPGAAAQAGVASQMKPLEEIPTTIINILRGVTQ
jgi:two-component system, chemotaxis family, protein-glutamate methylesterase/glutaminase